MCVSEAISTCRVVAALYLYLVSIISSSSVHPSDNGAAGLAAPHRAVQDLSWQGRRRASRFTRSRATHHIASRISYPSWVAACLTVRDAQLLNPGTVSGRTGLYELRSTGYYVLQKISSVACARNAPRSTPSASWSHWNCTCDGGQSRLHRRYILSLPHTLSSTPSS